MTFKEVTRVQGMNFWDGKDIENSNIGILDTFELGNSSIKYLNLQSQIEFGLYQNKMVLENKSRM